MSIPALWLTIVAAGLLTFGIRLSMVLLMNRVRLPAVLRQALRYVPTAVLGAIILPELVRPAGIVDLSWGNLRLVAGIIALLVAWRTRSVLVTIAAGMVTLWALQAIMR